MTGPADHRRIAETWKRVCFHLDGLAIGASVEALDRCGLLAGLAGQNAPVPVSRLAGDYGLRGGYLNLVFRLLELQGYAVRGGDISAGCADVRLTEAGQGWLANIGAYRGYRERVLAAQAIVAGQAGPPVPDVPRDGLSDRVRAHLAGPVTAAAMTWLVRSGTLGAGCDTARIDALPRTDLVGILAAQDWAREEDGALVLTEEGRIAVSCTPQYFYPVSYLPMLAACGSLLRGEADALADRDDAGAEAHVDRELDIAFSGIVFARTCRDPFFELALPLFDDLPLDSQPRAVVDCGGGDGTVLAELYHAICARTQRGRELESHPLVMVGVEYNPVAERVLAARLERDGIPALVFSGDIGNPAAIAARLAEAGFAPDDILHVSKSVFHNRTFAGTPMRDGAQSSGAFSAPDGSLLTAGQVEADLEALFRGWRKHLGRHGMIVIEAHIVPAELTADRLGRGVVTSLEASHGYSHQYLVEIEAHRTAARRAGLRVRGTHDFGAPYAGAPIMSIDHFDA